MLISASILAIEAPTAALLKGGLHNCGLTVSKSEGPGLRHKRRVRDCIGVGTCWQYRIVGPISKRCAIRNAVDRYQGVRKRCISDQEHKVSSSFIRRRALGEF